MEEPERPKASRGCLVTVLPWLRSGPTPHLDVGQAGNAMAMLATPSSSPVGVDTHTHTHTHTHTAAVLAAPPGR
jgi:hypothetical protein